MTLKISKRGIVPPFIVMDVMREAALLEQQGRSIVHLEVGQPSTGIPRGVIGKLSELMRDDALGYTVASGLPLLSERISDHYKTMYGLEVEAGRIFATTGSSGGFLLAFLSVFEPGDRVAIAAPGYPAYRHILHSLGVVPELISVDASTRYQPTVDHLKRLNPLPDGIIVGSPSNPTGTVIPAEEFKALAQFCDANGIRLISDEIYHGITFGSEAVTAANLTESAIVINSFSKYFSMTGWRLGWLVIPRELARPIECLAQNLFISPPTISQWGGIEAFNCHDELQANVQRYAQNREILLENLPDSGFEKLAPADGAFYLYADISNLSDDSLGFCRRMLNEAGVATTPGIDFDPFNGNRFVRFSFAGSSDDMLEACHRLKKWRNTI